KHGVTEGEAMRNTHRTDSRQRGTTAQGDLKSGSAVLRGAGIDGCCQNHCVRVSPEHEAWLASRLADWTLAQARRVFAPLTGPSPLSELGVLPCIAREHDHVRS